MKDSFDPPPFVSLVLPLQLMCVYEGGWVCCCYARVTLLPPLGGMFMRTYLDGSQEFHERMT